MIKFLIWLPFTIIAYILIVATWCIGKVLIKNYEPSFPKFRIKRRNDGGLYFEIV